MCIRADFASHEAICYTDGSYGEKDCVASGWGIYITGTMYDKSYFAPVSLAARESLYHGACRHTNNVAEVIAIGMALKWAHHHLKPGHSFLICYDSCYVAKMVRGRQCPQHNRSLLTWARLQFRNACARGLVISWQHVKGHSGVTGNEMADWAAKQGALGFSQVWPACSHESLPGDGATSSVSSSTSTLHDSIAALGAVPPRRVRCTFKHGKPLPRPPAADGIGQPWFLCSSSAAGTPPLSWTELSHILVEAAENVVGRGRPAQIGVPYTSDS